MRASAILNVGVVGVMIVSAAHAEPIRYRGEYTYGHEVNIFCPAINSQCYWLSSDTAEDVRNTLRALAEKNTSKPYDAQCVVIDAEIDRETQRDGFAADYDGFIGVLKFYGHCDETNIVTHGDLQHHRWVLESINGEALDVDAMHDRIPDLDFGEQMHVSGNSGCNQFSGTASLHDEYIRFGPLASTMMACSPAQSEVEGTNHALLARADIEIEINDNYLILQAGDLSLRYRLRDWVD